MRYRFIDAEKGRYPITLMCRVLEVAKSGYYAWRGRPVSARARANEGLVVEIRAVHRKSRESYGCPRIHRALSTPQRPVSKNRIARLMRISGIRSRHRRKFRVTTKSNHRRPVAPNLLGRQFTVAAPNRV